MKGEAVELRIHPAYDIGTIKVWIACDEGESDEVKRRKAYAKLKRLIESKSYESLIIF
ncbi:hypothetical protein OMP38_14620 [Cohnella ginsengisoli]|uniref:Uncharacterized protein n=1 Tax=Cohnella ginsengisoli TaxID=425004 RepID=A0A9X4KHA9_9BACL|nr:hypothetical protein [Cohnella ginsengisoli]MDG0791951.1 hypothetical protein [Cohnella ginsengisoli]